MAGIILAGGKSSRMGRDKALLPWAGRTVIERSVEILKSVTDQILIVANEADRYKINSVDQVIGDTYPGSGPLGGIITGLDYVRGGYHYVVACDLPFIRSEVLQFLMHSVEGHEACVPVVDGRLEPLCAVYHRCCRTTLRQVISRGEDLSIHMALKLLALQEVHEDQLRRIDPELKSFTNINTLEDYERANSSG